MARKARPSDSYAAKKERAVLLGYPSVRAMREAPKKGPPSAQQRGRREAAFAAVARARREDMPIVEAARREGVSVAAIRQWAPQAITREGGRLVARPNDRLRRPLVLVTTSGEKIALVRSARQASIVGAHHDAIGRYKETGEASVLVPFRGVRVAGFELETDPERLYRLYSGGSTYDVGVEGIYRWERVA
jgi:transposase-like protein